MDEGPLTLLWRQGCRGGIRGYGGKDIHKGVAQNLVQLESFLSGRKRSHSQMSREQQASNIEEEIRVFGLVTDSKEWLALECVLDMNTQNLSFSFLFCTI